MTVRDVKIKTQPGSKSELTCIFCRIYHKRAVRWSIRRILLTSGLIQEEFSSLTFDCVTESIYRGFSTPWHSTWDLWRRSAL